MNQSARSINLYLFNSALLFVHEIDSAYWKEWELFGIPGGIQLFLVLNLILVLIVLVGFKELLQGARSAYICSLLLAISGACAFVIHAYFILTGRPEFTLAVSLGVLALILMVSLVQGFDALRGMRASRIL